MYKMTQVCLNPYSNGICSKPQIDENDESSSTCRSLNPYSNGICSKPLLRDIGDGGTQPGVLILILMEYALSLVLLFDETMNPSNSLNPYSNGICSKPRKVGADPIVRFRS